MTKKILILIIIIAIICIGLIGCTPTPPSIIMQRNFEYAVYIFPEDVPIYIAGMELDDYGHFMFRCYVKEEYLEDFEPSKYDIANVYFICYSPKMSYDFYIKKDKYSICTDNPTEGNPEFAEFLKENHWDENYTDYQKLYDEKDITLLFEEEDTQILNDLASKMAQSAVGKEVGTTEEYVLGEIRSNPASGTYYYGDFDLKTMTMVFIRINITKEALSAYKASGEVTQQCVSTEVFDPYKYSEYVDEIIRNT